MTSLLSTVSRISTNNPGTPAPVSSQNSDDAGLDWFYACLIVAAGLWIYWPVLTGDWLWDDTQNITRNALIKLSSGFWKVWLHPDGQGDYDPLTSFVHWLQWHALGDSTLGYHLTNLGLHLTSAFLLWRLLHRLGLSAAWLGALVFTVHPLMVETVAWISELKNTLSLPFLLLAMISWLKYDEGKRRSDYLLALGLFLVAMLAKTSGLMLPVIFLGHAWWKYRKITREDGVRCLPFLLIALVAGLATAMAHPTVHLEQTVRDGGLACRLATAGWAFLFMLGKCIFPVGLLPAYPGRVIDTPTVFDFLPWLLIAGGIYFVWSRRTAWGMAVIAGMGFFLINLVPVLGFILKNYTAMIWSLDHLMYLPIIGLIGLFVAATRLVQSRLSQASRPLGTAIITLAVALMAFESHWYVVAFSDEETLWTYLHDRAPHFPTAVNNLARALLMANKPQEAKPYFEEILRLEPNQGGDHYNFGEVLEALGENERAVTEIQRAMQLLPDSAEMEDNLGVALGKLGRDAEAVRHFAQAVHLDPKNITAYTNLGSAWAHMGKYQDAVDTFSQALTIDPNSVTLHDNLGEALLKLGRPAEARTHFQKALALDPTDEAAKNELGKLTPGGSKQP